MSDNFFEQGFNDASTFAAEISNGRAVREIALHFGGETPGQAIEGLAEWSAANDEREAPFIITSLRLKESPGNISEFMVVVTVSEFV